MVGTQALTTELASTHSGSMALGTGLAFASLILVPALAARFGIGVALTGAVRIALMKASSRQRTEGMPTARPHPSASAVIETDSSPKRFVRL